MKYDEVVKEVDKMSQLEKNMLLTWMIRNTTLNEEEKKVVFDSIYKGGNLNLRKVYD